MEVGPGVFFLGTAMESGRMVEGYVFVDYRQGFAKPGGCNYDGRCTGWEDATCSDCTGTEASSSLCYSFLAKGARWKINEPFLLNAGNRHSLDEGYVLDTMHKSIGKWEAAAGYSIFGEGMITNNSLSADTISPDGANEVFFGDIDDRNAIAITVVWGIFRGPPAQREIVEWDVAFDENDFAWSDTGLPGTMDLESIATHVIGHAAGLDDIYDPACSEETMYGYASAGETKKRTLETGDILGIVELYS